MPLEISNSRTDSLAVDFARISPTALAGMTLDEVRRVMIPHGNGAETLGELFAVTGDAADRRWRLAGDFSATSGIGAGMTEGEIVVDGAVGRRAGHAMAGGRLEIRGQAGDWLGAEMRGGEIRVYGNAGLGVGGALVGARRGMTGGVILVDGDAGDDVGLRMRRGVIAIGGNAGDRLGRRMFGGTIVICGTCGSHVGASLRRGTIAIVGATSRSLWPTFRVSCRTELPLLRLVERELQRHGFNHPRLARLAEAIDLHNGDLLEGGRGELLIASSTS